MAAAWQTRARRGRHPLAALGGAFLASLVAGGPAAAAQPAAGLDQNVTTDTGGEAKAENAAPYSVDGFRSAHFGMTEEAVRNAIHVDFKLPDGKIVKETNATERTTALTISVPNLLPGAGAAKVSYIFGYAHKQLIHVNAIWTSPKPAEGQANDFLGAATALRNYFLALGFEREGLAHDAQLADGALLLFQGSDQKGRMVSLVAGTVQLPRGDKPPEVEQVIRLSYIENAKNPDIYRIPPGSF
jgi:hypothetical protein